MGPRNCTNCTSGFYLFENTCVTACPANYKPISTRACISCNNTCGLGLTYKTNTTNINGQTSIFLTFSNEININGHLQSTFKVFSNSRRLQTGGLAYQIIVIDSMTVQIVFPPGSTQSDYSVKIVNPQNIVDLNGNMPSSLFSQIQVDVSNLYATSISNAPNSFPTYFTFLSIICLISLLFNL